MTGKQFLASIKPLIRDHGFNEQYSLADLLDDCGSIGIDGAAELYLELIDRYMRETSREFSPTKPHTLIEPE